MVSVEQAFDAPQETGDELPAGTPLLHGQYKIVSFLNAGGFGITYRAVDSLDRKVVIKECFPGAFCRRSRQIVQPRSRAHKSEFDGIVRLFVEEARSLSKLQHPNIVGVHQVFEENDTAYMALDFVEGRDLLDILEDERSDLTPDMIVSILDDMLDAIRFVHAQDMLHRDISPDNILMDATGKPVLIDFGAARQQAQKESRVLSAMRVVKDGYSPQEFYITGSEQGPFSDLYALGASFYHLIAGEIPPDSQRRLTAIATGDADPYVPLSGRFPDYEEVVLASIDKALAILPKDRMQTAEEWMAAMNGEAPAPAPRVVSRRLSRRAEPRAANEAAAPKKGGKGLLVAGVAVIAVAAGLGYVMTQGVPDDVEAPVIAGAAVPLDESSVAGMPVAEPEGIDETAFAVAPAVDATVPSAPPAPALSETSPESPTAEASAPDAEIVPIVDATRPDDAPFVPQERFAPEDSRRPAARPEVAAAPEPLPTPGTGADPAGAPALASPSGAARGQDAAVASLPADQDGARGWTDFLPVVGEIPGAELVPYEPVKAGWTLALPYDDLRVDAQGRSWVVSVDGTSIPDRAAFDAFVAAKGDLSSLETVDIAMGIGPKGASPDFVQNATLAAVFDVRVPDGPTFRAAREDGEWVTRVTSVGEGAFTTLQLGDVVIGSMETGIPFDGPRGLAEKLDEAISAGGRNLGFAVKRDGSTWVAELTLTRTEAR